MLAPALTAVPLLPEIVAFAVPPTQDPFVLKVSAKASGKARSTSIASTAIFINFTRFLSFPALASSRNRQPSPGSLFPRSTYPDTVAQPSRRRKITAVTGRDYGRHPGRDYRRLRAGLLELLPPLSNAQKSHAPWRASVRW